MQGRRRWGCITRFPEGVRDQTEEAEGALAMSEATFPSTIGSMTCGESPIVFMNSLLLICSCPLGSEECTKDTEFELLWLAWP